MEWQIQCDVTDVLTQLRTAAQVLHCTCLTWCTEHGQHVAATQTDSKICQASICATDVM